MALEKFIIDQEVFDQLELLYKERNKVVHRYVITDIRTQEVLQIAYKYYLLEEKISLLVNELEHKQFELQIGINATDTVPGSVVDDDFREKIKLAVRDKHGAVRWKTKDSEQPKSR
jgi:hypothetical protein